MNSPLCYIGGKSQLSNIISEKIPSHKTYVEVFAGAAWVFFCKSPSKVEVINDKDGELISFYRVLQNHLEEFLRQFKWLLSSRELFEDFSKQLDAGGLTDIQKACRYYYIQRQCFGGRVRGRSFGIVPEDPPRINLLRMEEELSQVHLRLARVTIENMDWSDLLTRYDRPETFFYMDPPYYKMPFYKYNFEPMDFLKMSAILSGLSGKFIMSINDEPFIRETFSRFKIQEVDVRYSVQKEGSQVGRELLISNY